MSSPEFRTSWALFFLAMMVSPCGLPTCEPVRYCNHGLLGESLQVAAGVFGWLGVGQDRGERCCRRVPGVEPHGATGYH